jgi:hypothetical protein
MPLMTKPSAEAKIAIMFVTLGALIVVWSGVWYLYQYNHAPDTPASERYVCYGSILSGCVLLVIGLALGRIARSARQAEMPPHEIAPAESQISQEAASRAQIATPSGSGGAVVAGNGAPGGTNPAATAAVKPVAPVARVVPANPSNAPNEAANTTANATPSSNF